MYRLTADGPEVLLQTPYHPEVVEACRETSGRWDPAARAWRFPVARLEGLERALTARGFPPLPPEAKEAAAAWKARRERALAQAAHPALLPEQAEDARRLLKALLEALEGKGPRGALLAHGTGTGKTYVYGGFLRGVAALGLPALVLVPNWELARQAAAVLEALGVKAPVATYGTFRSEEAAGRVLVLDEAHLVKRSAQSQRGRRAWEAVRRARFALFATATPFDRPWESAYLLVPAGALQAWGEASFDRFMARFGVRVRRGFGGRWEHYFAGSPEDLAAFHDFLKERGFMRRRLYVPPPGLVEHEVAFLDLPQEEKSLLAEVRRRLKRATHEHFELKPQLMAQRTLLSRALLERMKLKTAFPLLERLLEEGWHVALFLHYRGDRELDLSTPEGLEAFLQEAEERGAERLALPIAKALAGLHLHLPSPLALLEERFGHLGEALAFYTGAQGPKDLQRAKRAWDRGRVRLLALTAQKGGTGLSLHDTGGKRPTAQVVLTLPWTGSQLDQVLGRVVRVGLASPVRVVFPAAPVPFEQRLATIVAGSLRTLGHAVRGGKMPVPEKVIRAFLHDLPLVDPEAFGRLLYQETSPEV